MWFVDISLHIVATLKHTVLVYESIVSHVGHSNDDLAVASNSFLHFLKRR